MTVAICDDNQDVVNVIEKALKEYKGEVLEVISFTKGEDLIEYIKSNKIDIAYMDIDLNSFRTGMEIGKKIKQMQETILIIFMSSYQIYYREIANAEPFRYIDKAT